MWLGNTVFLVVVWLFYSFSHAIESVEFCSVNKIQLPVGLLMDYIFGVIF